MAAKNKIQRRMTISMIQNGYDRIIVKLGFNPSWPRLGD